MNIYCHLDNWNRRTTNEKFSVNVQIQDLNKKYIDNEKQIQNIIRGESIIQIDQITLIMEKIN